MTIRLLAPLEERKGRHVTQARRGLCPMSVAATAARSAVVSKPNPVHVDLPHCVDCRRISGAPVVCWAGFPELGADLEKGAAETFEFIRLRDPRFLRRFRHGPLLPERTALARYRRGPAQRRWTSRRRCDRTSICRRQRQLDGDGARTVVGRTLCGDGLARSCCEAKALAVALSVHSSSSPSSKML